MEGKRILRFLGLDAVRVVGAEPVQCDEVQEHNGNNHERQQVVQGVEPIERGIADPKPAHSQVTMLSPTSGMAEKRLVMTVAPQKLIWPQGNV